MKLRSICNTQAIARLATVKAPLRKWGTLPPPVMPMDTMACIRAQSLLTCARFRYRDGSTNPNMLTLAQAQDVLRWATGAQL